MLGNKNIKEELVALRYKFLLVEYIKGTLRSVRVSPY